MAFCIECGTNLPDSAKYCSSCGTRRAPDLNGEGSDVNQATGTLQPVVGPDTTGPRSTAKTHHLAVSSLVVGILSLVMGLVGQGWLGILAAVHGHRARRQIGESRGAQEGAGLATAGLVLGYLAILFTVSYVMNNLPESG